MKKLTIFLLLTFLATASISFATRPDPITSAAPKDKTHKSTGNIKKGGGGGGGGAGGWFFDPGSGFNIPGLPPNWGNGIVGGGYGSGYGGPKGGSSSGGIVRGSIVCKDKGSSCYKKKLTCPAKCFTAYGRSGKGFGGGGGGGRGGCTVDCKKCVAYC